MAEIAGISTVIPVDINGAPLTTTVGNQYELVAAGQTAQVLGATGAINDLLTGIWIIPATTTPGLVTILDNAISIPLFVGGASSLTALIPIYMVLGLRSVSGAWKCTTGSNVSVLAIGTFT